eukprot:gb/GECG01006842.1/.p1 GENE.gb/GECG01006842.1/~~gb/GECG01006842.1/.p1  ORF type:complete len:453 (+),score=54.60 gb/GECG01006842.1/:1-1359(+)
MKRALDPSVKTQNGGYNDDLEPLQHDKKHSKQSHHGSKLPFDVMTPESQEEATPFRKAVLELCSRIPRGQVSTYNAIAKALPKSAPRPVGQALRHNPWAPDVPCHRVVRSDGSIGGFSGKMGESQPEIVRKRKFLQDEGVKFTESGKVHGSCLYLEFTKDDKEAAARWYYSSREKDNRKKTSADLKFEEPAELRQACRRGEFRGQTSGQCMGYAQANLVMIPEEFAEDFRQFCNLNPKACPLLEETVNNTFEAKRMAPHSDLRTDLPKYCLWENGKRLNKEVYDVTQFLHTKKHKVRCFLLGCSFSFEEALLAEGLPVRHIQQHRNVPMYVTNIDCQTSGVFSAKLVVSMRPLTPKQAQQATRITNGFPSVHGGPIQIGNAQSLGIKDLNRPDFGDAVDTHEGEVPVFWACGVTPQNAILNAKKLLPFAITHSPGCMFVTDVKNAQLEAALQ